MRAPARPPEHYLHGTAGPVVVVPARVAAWLGQHGLNALRVASRGVDPEVDAVLSALHQAALVWRTSAAPEVASEVPGPCAEVDPGLTWLSSSKAADLLGIGDRAVRLAIQEGRLPAQQVGGRWQITREDVEHYRAARVA